MQKLSKVILDGKKRKMFFDGSCPEVVKLCEAMCCREWNINLSYDELKSGLYKSEIFCTLSGDKCENPKISCMNREYRLKKKEDGSCVYLNSDNECLIYKKRPKVCKDFSCKEGWKTSWVDSPITKNNSEEMAGKPLVDGRLLEKLKFDMVFIINPLIELKGIFYLKEEDKIIFLEKIVGRCNLYSFNLKFYNPTMDDNSLFYLINLFNGKNNLEDTYQSTKKKYNLDLPKESFLKIIGLLFENNIIVFKSAK
jgi:Fe-S-cluster containining protein